MKNQLIHYLIPSLIIVALAGEFQRVRANTELWIGVSGSSVTTNWSDNANWSNVSGGGGPGPNGNDVIFGDIGAVGTAGEVTSVVDQNLLNPFSLTFTNGAGGALDQTVWVPAGIFVTNANGLTVGRANLAAANYVVNAAFAGEGTLVQNGATMIIDNSSTTASSGVMPTLDLSGLSNFVATAITTLNIAGSGSESRGEGTLNLAQLNFITATNITMNTGNGNPASAGGTINLGQTTNAINVTTLVAGQTKGRSGTVQFFGPTGGLRIRGVTGADSDRNVTLTLGDRNNTGSATTLGQLLLNGHQVDVKATTLVVGQDRSGSGSSTHAGSGTVQFDTGTIDVTTVNMAIATSAGTSSSATGTITVGGTGMLLVGTGGIALGNRSGGSTSATATLNINGGTVNSAGNLAKVNVAATANINMNQGYLIIGSGKTVGTLSAPIDNVSLSDSTNTMDPSSGTVVYANTLTTGGSGNTINISTLPVITSYPKQYPLIQFSGIINGSGFNFALGTLPAASPAYQGYISNNVSSVDLVVTNGPIPVGLDDWTGVVNNNWDLTSLNWTNLGVAVAFHQGDAVQFDDSVPGSSDINLATNVNPGSMTVSNFTHAYTLGGPGALVGTADIVKYGNSSLTLTNSGTNTFVGGITINAGTLQFGNGSTLGNLPVNSQFITDNGNLVLDLSTSYAVQNVISGTGNLAQNGSGVVSLAVSNSYSGTTTVNAGSLMVDGYIGGGGVVTNAAGSTVGGTNTIIGTLNCSGVVSPGDVNGIGTLTINGNTTLYPGAMCSFDLNATDTTSGNGINDLLSITGNLTADNNTLSINVQGMPQPGTYNVINYAGALSGTFNSTVGGTHYAANVDTSTPNQVNVVITGTSGANMKWASTGSTAWDDATPNWLNLGSSAADDFYSGDAVLMDDSVANVQTNLIIPAGVSMYPTIVSNISSVNNYTISGGSIGGAASLVKDGASTLTINDTNTFTGTVDVYGGTLRTGSGTALGTTAGGTTIHPGATLDVNGQNLGAEVITVSGSGVGGLGAIINSGLQQVNALKNVTLAGDTTFGGGSSLTNAGSGRWDIRGSGATLQASGSPVNITKVGTNQVSLVGCICNDPNLENVDIQAGNLAIQTSSTQLGDANGFIYVHTNAILDVWALTAGLSKNIWLQDGGEIYSESGSTAVSGTLTLTNNALNTAPGTGIINNNSGTTLVVNSVVQGPGNLLKTGAGQTQFASAETYTGSTTIGAGTLALTSSGSIATSPLITVSSGATFDVTAVAPLVLTANQTLQGSGTINGDYQVPAGSTVQVGTPTAIGKLSDTGNVTLAGTNNMKLSHVASATNDVLAATGAINLGGTLNISLLGGTFAGGDTFTLYSAAGGLSGTFSATNLPVLPTGLVWVTTNLVNGVLSIMATVNTNPTNITTSVSGNVLTLSWPADHTGWRLLAQTNSIANGLDPNPSGWTYVTGSSSVNSVSITMDPTKGTVFYRLVYP